MIMKPTPKCVQTSGQQNDQSRTHRGIYISRVQILYIYLVTGNKNVSFITIYNIIDLIDGNLYGYLNQSNWGSTKVVIMILNCNWL